MLAELVLSRILAKHIVKELSDEIGLLLEKAREAEGISVDDVVFRTRIPRGVVEALEAGDFSFFSSPTYAKSFLSQYSQFLKVDADPWLDALEPASFLAGDIGEHLLGAGVAKVDENFSDSKSGTNWLASLSLLLLSGGLVFAAIKGYDFFEKRFEGELSSSASEADRVPEFAAPSEAPASQVAVPEVAEATSPASQRVVPLVVEPSAQAIESAQTSNESLADELPQPPPRAIIVR